MIYLVLSRLSQLASAVRVAKP